MIPAGALQGHGDMALLFRKHNWAASPLGAPQSWPVSLATMVGFAMHSPLAVAIVWGRELTTVYNDAYSKLLGAKHPDVFGKSFRELWPDFWANAQPLVELAYRGEASFFDDVPFSIQHTSGTVDAWITFSCSPLFDDDGKVAGMAAICVDTTAKVGVQRARDEAHRHVLSLFEQAPGLVAIVQGPNHVFSFMNRAYREFVGGRDLIGQPVKEALPDLAAQGFGELIDRVYASGEPFIGTEVAAMIRQWPQEEAEQRYFDFIYQPIRDDDGTVTGIFTEGIDVTARVKKAAAEREGERRLRLLADVIPQMVWMADADGALSWFNQRWLDYTGMALTDALGWGWKPVLRDEDTHAVVEQWHACIASGTPFESILHMQGKDGNYRPFYTLAVPLRDEAGTVVQWFGTNTDISSIEEAQTELRRTRNWLQQGLDTGKMVVWEWDLQTDRIKYSDNATSVLGYMFGDVNDSWAQVHPEDVERMRAAVDEAVAQRGEFHEINRRVDPGSGRVRWVEQRGRVNCDAAGAAISIHGVNIDVTDRKLAELELTEANRRKDEFLAMLAHELRNPLAPISSAAYMLKIASGDEERIRRTADIIERQVGHMTELLDDLLDVSRVTRGLVTIEKAAVDVKSVIASAIEQVRPLLESRQHALTVHAAANPVFVEGDYTRLVQVVANLLTNACKYTPPRGTLRIDLETGDAQLHLAVADNGVGIDADLLPRVFDLFTQAKRTPDRAQGGLGLGLALVRAMVEQHGGRVRAASDGADRGSTFTVSLPYISTCPDTKDVARQASIAPLAPGLHIALVDDNIDAAEMMAAALQASGYRVLVAHDAPSLLASTVLGQIRVFVLDIGLPEMDGYALARALRARDDTRDALIVALTGYGQDSDLELARAAGFDHHLTKPASPERLQAVLAEARSAPI